MTRITLLQPQSSSAEMYVNPLELQRFAGYLLERKDPEQVVDLIDLNTRVRAPLPTMEEISRRTDILCVSTPAASIASLAVDYLKNFVRRGGALVFVGEAVADGLTESLLRNFHVAGHPVFGFVGRTESEFGALIAEIQYGGTAVEKLANVHVLSADGLYQKGPEPLLAAQGRASRPYFSSDMILEIKQRGLFVLMDGLSRGCEHHCNYCRLNNSPQTAAIVQEVTGSTVSLMADLSTALNTYTYVQFADENFFGGRTPGEQTSRLTRIRQLADELRSSSFVGMVGVDTRADTVVNPKDEPQIATARAAAWDAMAEASLRYTYLGIETLSRSQGKRYSKALDLGCILPTLEFLENRKIAYTVGLIVLDPFVSLEEIASTVDFIEEHDLHGNIASLLKEMRVSVRSPYYTSLVKSGLQPHQVVDNYVYLNRDTVQYRDPRVSSILPITRMVHELLSSNGYRHSDLSAMHVFGRFSDLSALARIPALIGRMEVAVWKYLITNQDSPFETKRASVLAIAQETINIVAGALSDDLRANSQLEYQQEKIRQYYTRVFDRIRWALSALGAATAPSTASSN